VLAEAKVSRFERFWLAAREDVLVRALLELMMVTHVGVVEESLPLYLPWFLLLRKTLYPRSRTMDSRRREGYLVMYSRSTKTKNLGHCPKAVHSFLFRAPVEACYLPQGVYMIVFLFTSHVGDALK
jgi:hypothetical protein